MDEITLDGKIYVSSKRSAKITGYAKDYVGQLCREGKVEARLVGRNWYVLETSIREHRFGPEKIAVEKTKAMPSENLPAVSEVLATPAATTETFASDTWKSTNYVSLPATEAPLIPETKPVVLAQVVASIDSVPSIAQVEAPPIVKEESVPGLPPVEQMQNTWQDWFKGADSYKMPEEVVGETYYTKEVSVEDPINVAKIEHRLDEIEPKNEQNDKQNNVVRLNKISQLDTNESLSKVKSGGVNSFHEEESVPIKRNFIQRTTQSLPIKNPSYATKVDPLTEEFGKWEAKKLEMQPKIKDKALQRAAQRPSLILQAFLLSLAGLAIVVTIIGSGKLDSFMTGSKIFTKPMQYLGGENTLVKPLK